MFERVLFVCVGNICRSPMAEAVARAKLAGKPGLEVGSAGLGALVGRGADPLAVELLRERDLDLSGHTARQLTAELLRSSELVLTMEQWQVREVERLSPTARGKVFRLGHWGGFEIPDPYRQPRAAFAQALAQIDRGVADLERLLRGGPGGPRGR